MPCTGYVIKYAECPLLWCSKLQTEIALSTTEAEYISLIQAMRKVIPCVALMKEVCFIFDIHLQSQKSFVNYSNTIKILLLLRSLKNHPQSQNISLLSIIIYKSAYKIRLFGYVILIHENKHQSFSLCHLMKHYLSIYEENYMCGDLKSETFA